jgi:VWFA-related protein
MDFFRFSGISQRFLQGAWPMAGLLLAAGSAAVYAQTGASNPQAVVVRVVADSGGQPVSDLKASDFAVLDNGSPQQIVSLRLQQSDRPHPVVILFDLLNAGESSRGAVWKAVKTELPRLQSAGQVYLYLLVADGGLYPVHALPATPAAQVAASADWLKDIGPLLDAAMQKVSQLKPQDLRAASPTSLQSRFKASYDALENMRAMMARMPGPKELLWVTYGVPSAIQLVDRTWFDGAPLLRQLGTRFVQSGATVYTADPGMNLQAGVLDRDSLDILAGVTGGRAFSTIDLNRAITRIEADALTNYSLAYQPSANNWDGKFHKLRVTVARKGIHVQTEAGYYAASGS